MHTTWSDDFSHDLIGPGDGSVRYFTQREWVAGAWGGFAVPFTYGAGLRYERHPGIGVVIDPDGTLPTDPWGSVEVGLRARVSGTGGAPPPWMQFVFGWLWPDADLSAGGVDWSTYVGAQYVLYGDVTVGSGGCYLSGGLAHVLIDTAATIAGGGPGDEPSLTYYENPAGQDATVAHDMRVTLTGNGLVVVEQGIHPTTAPDVSPPPTKAITVQCDPSYVPLFADMAAGGVIFPFFQVSCPTGDQVTIEEWHYTAGPTGHSTGGAAVGAKPGTVVASAAGVEGMQGIVRWKAPPVGQ